MTFGPEIRTVLKRAFQPRNKELDRLVARVEQHERDVERACEQSEMAGTLGLVARKLEL